MNPTLTALLDLAVLFGVPAAAILVIGLFDVWMDVRYGSQATISAVMRSLGQRWPIVPFLVGIVVGLLVGVLAGHFWAGF